MKDFAFSHRTDIQGMRGIAVLLVVLYHLNLPVVGGFIGVDVFFVISGFVITGGILRSLHKAEGFDVGAFFRRRARRLLPALSCVLTICTLLGIFFGPEVSQKVSGRTALAAMLLNANHYLFRAGGYFQPAAEENFFLHTWSLSVEEQFYLLFPFIMVFGWRVGRQKLESLQFVLLVLMVASFGFCLWLTFSDTGLLNGPHFAFFSSASRAWQFGAGALVACSIPALTRLRPDFPKIWTKWLGWLGLILVVGSSVILTPHLVFPGYLALVPTVGAAFLLIPGCLEEGCILQRTLSFPALQRLGDLSYAWYLWHWPLIVFAHATFPNSTAAVLGSALISLLLAWCTERFVEVPLRKKTDVPLAWLLLAVFSFPLMAWVVQIQFSPGHERVEQLKKMQIDYAEIGCDSTEPFDSDSIDCRWGRDGNWKLVLLGDSNARQHIPALKEIVVRRNGEFHTSTSSACPFLFDTLPVVLGRPKELCKRWVNESIEEVLSAMPDIVVVSSALDGYTSSSNWALLDPDGNQVDIRKAIERTTKRLQESGALVVYLSPIPKLYDAEGEPSTRFGSKCSLVAHSIFSERCAPDWSSADDGLLKFDSSVYSAGDISPLVVELKNPICPEGVCKTHDGVDWVYHDAGHLSVYGSGLTQKFLEAQLEPLISEIAMP